LKSDFWNLSGMRDRIEKVPATYENFPAGGHETAEAGGLAD
jgi:hypothetical protein